MYWHYILVPRCFDYSFGSFVPVHVSVSLCTDAGAIAGGIIAAILISVGIGGLLYYVFKVRGYKLSGLSLPTRTTSRIDVVS